MSQRWVIGAVVLIIGFLTISAGAYAWRCGDNLWGAILLNGGGMMVASVIAFVEFGA